MFALNIVRAVLAFLGCIALACALGAFFSGMGVLTTLEFLGAGLVLLAPSVLGPRSLPDATPEALASRARIASRSARVLAYVSGIGFAACGAFPQAGR